MSFLVGGAAGGTGGGITNINLSAGTTSRNLSNFVLSNSNGLSFGLNGSTVTASHNGITSQSVQTQNLVSFQGSTGNISFANSNGITFGGNASTVTASHNGLTSQSNQALSGANGSFTFQTASFANSNGVSFSTGTQGLYASHNGLTSQSNQALSGSNGSYTFQTATFGALNGLSFYTSNGSMVGSYTVPSVPAQTNQTLGLYGVSNTTLSTSGTVDARTLSFQGAGGVSVGVSNGSVVISGATGGGGGLTNVNLSAGTTSQNLSNVVFSNSNGVSFGLNGSTVTASVAGGGGLTNINLSAGTTSQNLSNFVFSNGNNVSFGLNGSTITGSVAAPGGGGDYAMSYFDNYGHLGHITRGVRAGAVAWTAKPLFMPIEIGGSGLIASRVRLLLERSAGTSLNMTMGCAFYSHVNNTSCALISSTTNAVSLTTSAQWSGLRVYDILGLSALTFTKGQYVLGLYFSGSGGSSAVQDFNFYGANRPLPVGFVFSGTNSTGATNSSSMVFPFAAVLSTTSNGFPANVRTQDLNHTLSANQAVQIHGSGL